MKKENKKSPNIEELNEKLEEFRNKYNNTIQPDTGKTPAEMYKEGMKKDKSEKEEFWHPNSFVQSISKEEIEAKKDTIDKGHDENMNFNCKKCNKKISAHNKDWHDEMCDDCFNKEYFGDKSDDAQKEALEVADEIFENEVWNDAKEGLKELTKKEACKSMFSMGFLTYMQIMDEESLELGEKAKSNPEEFEKAIRKFKEESLK